MKKLEEYTKSITEKIDAHRELQSNYWSVAEKIQYFALRYTKDIDSEIIKDKEYSNATFGLIVYKLIGYLESKNIAVPKEASNWLKKNQQLVDKIIEHEHFLEDKKDILSPYDLKTWIIGRNKNDYNEQKERFSTIFDPELIESLFQGNDLVTAYEQLQQVRKIIDAILLRRKIESLDIKNLKSLYYEFTCSNNINFINNIKAEIESIKQRYKNNQELDSEDYLNDSYYITMTNRLNEEKEKEAEYKKQIDLLPLEVLKDTLYQKISNNTADFESQKRQNDTRKELIKSGYDIAGLDNEIEDNLYKLYLLGCSSQKTYFTPTIKSLLEQQEKLIIDIRQLDEEYARLTETDGYGLAKPLQAYMQEHEKEKKLSSTRRNILKEIKDAEKAEKEYYEMNAFTQMFSQKGKDLKTKKDKKTSLQQQYDDAIKQTEEITHNKVELFKHIQPAYKAFIQKQASSLFDINSAVGLVMLEAFRPDPKAWENRGLNYTILEESKVDIETAPVYIMDKGVILLAPIFDKNNTNSLWNVLPTRKKEAEQFLQDTKTQISKTLKLFPTLIAKGLTPETVTTQEFNQEVTRCQTRLAYLYDVKAGRVDPILDKALEIVDSSEDANGNNSLAMTDDDFKTLVKTRLNQITKSKPTN